MSKPTYINGSEIFEEYGARLLDYSIGPVSIKDSYFTPPNSMRPVKINESLGTRPVKIRLEFTGDSHLEVLKKISNMTSTLIQESEIALPDGFTYHTVLKGVSEPDLKGEIYYVVMFTLEGYRHLAMETVSFDTSTWTHQVFNVEGNCETPAIITIDANESEVTIDGITISNIIGTIVINGMDCTVTETENGSTYNKFKDTNLTKFPKLSPGRCSITKSGMATVKIQYYPIYL